jgi:hypothetical protein
VLVRHPVDVGFCLLHAFLQDLEGAAAAAAAGGGMGAAAGGPSAPGAAGAGSQPPSRAASPSLVSMGLWFRAYAVLGSNWKCMWCPGVDKGVLNGWCGVFVSSPDICVDLSSQGDLGLIQEVRVQPLQCSRPDCGVGWARLGRNLLCTLDV